MGYHHMLFKEYRIEGKPDGGSPFIQIAKEVPL